MSFLRKQESRLPMPLKSPSPGLAFGQAGLSHQGRGDLLHSAKVLPTFLITLFPCQTTCWQSEGIVRPAAGRISAVRSLQVVWAG